MTETTRVNSSSAVSLLIDAADRVTNATISPSYEALFFQNNLERALIGLKEVERTFIVIEKKAASTKKKVLIPLVMVNILSPVVFILLIIELSIEIQSNCIEYKNFPIIGLVFSGINFIALALFDLFVLEMIKETKDLLGVEKVVTPSSLSTTFKAVFSLLKRLKQNENKTLKLKQKITRYQESSKKRQAHGQGSPSTSSLTKTSSSDADEENEDKDLEIGSPPSNVSVTIDYGRIIYKDEGLTGE